MASNLPYESANDKRVTSLSKVGKTANSWMNFTCFTAITAHLAGIIVPNMPLDTTIKVTLPLTLILGALRRYSTSNAATSIENVYERGVVKDALFNMGQEYTDGSTDPNLLSLSSLCGKLLTDGLLKEPRHYESYFIKQSTQALVKGDFFLLLDTVASTFDRDKLLQIYSKHSALQVNLLHMAVLMGSNANVPANTYNIDDALNHPSIQAIFANSKRLLPTLADNIPSTYGFLRTLLESLGEDLGPMILKEPITTLKAVKEYDTLAHAMISKGAVYAESAYIAEVLTTYASTLAKDARTGLVPLPYLRTAINDISALRKALSDRVEAHNERQAGKHIVKKSSLEFLVPACDLLLGQYTPMFIRGMEQANTTPTSSPLLAHHVEATDNEKYFARLKPNQLHDRLFGKNAPDYIGENAPDYKSPKRNTDEDDKKPSIHTHFIKGVVSALEDAVMSNNNFLSRHTPSNQAVECAKIVNRVLQRALLCTLADKKPPADEIKVVRTQDPIKKISLDELHVSVKRR